MAVDGMLDDEADVDAGLTQRAVGLALADGSVAARSDPLDPTGDSPIMCSGWKARPER
jgi:hypothetical protein